MHRNATRIVTRRRGSAGACQRRRGLEPDAHHESSNVASSGLRVRTWPYILLGGLVGHSGSSQGPLGIRTSSNAASRGPSNPTQTPNPPMWLRGPFWSFSGASWNPNSTINPLMWPRGVWWGHLGASWKPNQAINPLMWPRRGLFEVDPDQTSCQVASWGLLQAPGGFMEPKTDHSSSNVAALGFFEPDADPAYSNVASCFFLQILGGFW